MSGAAWGGAATGGTGGSGAGGTAGGAVVVPAARMFASVASSRPAVMLTASSTNATPTTASSVRMGPRVLIVIGLQVGHQVGHRELRGELRTAHNTGQVGQRFTASGEFLRRTGVTVCV